VKSRLLMARTARTSHQDTLPSLHQELLITASKYGVYDIHLLLVKVGSYVKSTAIIWSEIQRCKSANLATQMLSNITQP